MKDQTKVNLIVGSWLALIVIGAFLGVFKY